MTCGSLGRGARDPFNNVSREADLPDYEHDQRDGSSKAPQALLEQCTATGEIEGLEIPTVSLFAQQLFHSGYPPRPEERQAADIIRLLSEDQSSRTNHGVFPF
jgi:hypothetical protein